MKRWRSIAVLAWGSFLIASLTGCAFEGASSGAEAETNAVSPGEWANGSFDYHIQKNSLQGMGLDSMQATRLTKHRSYFQGGATWMAFHPKKQY